MTNSLTPKSLRVLRLVLSVEESSAPYNQFSLTLHKEQDITICTYFAAVIPVHKDIKLIEGNGTVLGYFRALLTVAGNFDVVHAHGPHVGFLFLVINWLGNRRLLGRTVYTVHSSYTNYKWRNKLMLVPIFICFRSIIYCSNASFKSFPGLFKHLAGKRAAVIPNGVDLARIDGTIRNHRRHCVRDTFTIATVGRLINLKRPLTILEAFEKTVFQKAQLLFIGDGILRNCIAAETRKKNLEHCVRIIGKVARDTVFEYLSCADLFVSASEVEGLPVAVLEAMACRCPVVLSDIPPHREIADGVNFIPLVPVGDVDGLAYHIRRFSNMSASEKKAIGEQCRELVEKRFNLIEMLTVYKRIYNDISSNRLY